MTRLSDQTQHARQMRRAAELWFIQIGPDPDAEQHLLILAQACLTEEQYQSWLHGRDNYSTNRGGISAKGMGVVV